MTFFGQVSTQLRQSTHSSFFMLPFATIFCTSRPMGHILLQDPQEMHLELSAFSLNRRIPVRSPILVPMMLNGAIQQA